MPNSILISTDIQQLLYTRKSLRAELDRAKAAAQAESDHAANVLIAYDQAAASSTIALDRFLNFYFAAQKPNVNYSINNNSYILSKFGGRDYLGTIKAGGFNPMADENTALFKASIISDVKAKVELKEKDVQKLLTSLTEVEANIQALAAIDPEAAKNAEKEVNAANNNEHLKPMIYLAVGIIVILFLFKRFF